MATAWEKEVGDAIAAKIAGVSGMAGAVFPGTDNIANFPAAIVEVPHLKLLARTGSFDRWQADYPFTVFPPIGATVDQTLDGIVALMSAIRLLWWVGTNLGLAYVDESKLTELAPDMAGEAGEDYPIVSGNVFVQVTQTGQRT
jgi:hypothetical protein